MWRFYFLPSSRNSLCSRQYLLLLILPLRLWEDPGSVPSTATCQVIEDSKTNSCKLSLLLAEETIFLFVSVLVFCLHLAFRLLHFFGGLPASLLQHSSVFLVLGSSKLNTVLQIRSHKYQKEANPFSRPAAYSFAGRTRYAVDIFHHKSTLLAHTLACCLPGLQGLSCKTAFQAASFPPGLRQGSSLASAGRTLHLPSDLTGFLSARL